MDNKKILYIGPYNEESNRGRSSLNNIRGLYKKKHLLRIVPIYYPGQFFNETPEDLLELEKNNLDNYDICIQDCDPNFYCFNEAIKKHIAIYPASNIIDEPILNTKMCFADKIVVNSQKQYRKLLYLLSKNLMCNVSYCPNYIDINNTDYNTKEKLDWANGEKYYFYTEVSFNDTYDWEKLIYVYINSLVNKNCGLVIKTIGIDSKEDSDQINQRINEIARSVNINRKENLPHIFNGIYDKTSTVKLYNSIDCFIDCCRTDDYNNNIFLAALLKKDIICNEKLAASEFFEKIYKVDAYACNISSCLYSRNYTMESNSLRDTMIKAYYGRYSSDKITKEQLEKYDISNINDLLC